jgi:hypothetical protein
MNVATVAPLPAAVLMRADAIRVLVLLRPTMARFAPRAASASAAANPMPLGAPVNQDLLVVHGTAIQGYGHARMTCSMVKDLALNQPLTHGALKRGSRRAPASRSSSSTRNHPIRPSIKTAEGDEGATSLHQIADALNTRGVSTPRGGRWHAKSVANLLARAKA